jgi:hypothetical protein
VDAFLALLATRPDFILPRSLCALPSARPRIAELAGHDLFEE